LCLAADGYADDMEEFGRFWGLNSRSEERDAEERWREIREEIAGDYRQENQRWHQDPVNTKTKSEKMLIMEAYPPHLTVVNGLAQNDDGTWTDETSPAVVDAVREFERGDWPLGTAVQDTVPRLIQVSYPE